MVLSQVICLKMQFTSHGLFRHGKVSYISNLNSEKLNHVFKNIHEAL